MICTVPRRLFLSEGIWLSVCVLMFRGFDVENTSKQTQMREKSWRIETKESFLPKDNYTYITYLYRHEKASREGDREGMLGREKRKKYFSYFI